MLQTKQGIIAAVVLMGIAFVSSFLSDNTEDVTEAENEETIEQPVPVEEKKKKKLKFGKKKEPPKEEENFVKLPETHTKEIVIGAIPKETVTLWGIYFKAVPYDDIEKMHTNIILRP